MTFLSRATSVAACLLLTALAHGQAVPKPAPNAVRFTKYIFGVADLDRSYAFYHALGLELSGPATLGKANALPDILLKLVDVPPGTKFRNMMLKVPNAPFALEVTEFSGMELHPVKPRIQDPGAALLELTVDNLDLAVTAARKAGAETAGSPLKLGTNRAVIIKDPDGYYLQLAQAAGAPAGNGKVIGSGFGSMMVRDAEKAAAFYRDHFGLEAKNTDWVSSLNPAFGLQSGQSRRSGVTVAGSGIFWGFFEFKGLDRQPYTPRIPDPGAPAIGLEVHDIDAAIAAIKAAGGSSVTRGGSVKLGNGKVGFVRDPNGLLVELAQP